MSGLGSLSRLTFSSGLYHRLGTLTIGGRLGFSNGFRNGLCRLNRLNGLSGLGSLSRLTFSSGLYHRLGTLPFSNRLRNRLNNLSPLPRRRLHSSGPGRRLGRRLDRLGRSRLRPARGCFRLCGFTLGGLHPAELHGFHTAFGMVFLTGHQTGVDMSRSRGADGRIFDTFVEHALEHGGEGLTDPLHILQGQGRIVQLAVVQLALHQLVDEILNGLGRGVGHAAHGGLHRIRQHDDGAFLGLGPFAIVAEIGDIHPGVAGLLGGLVVEIHHRGIAVMLCNDVLDLHRQTVLLGQHKTIPGVGRNDGGGHIGIGVLMGVVPDLILLEIQGPLQLADIVEIGAGPGQQLVGIHAFGSSLRQIGHDDAVVIGAGGLDQQPPQQRMIGVAQLHQLGGGGQIEQALHQRVEGHAENGRTCGSRAAPDGVSGHIVQGGVGHKAHDQDQGSVDHRRDDTAQQDLLTVGLAAHDQQHGKAADQRGHDDVDGLGAEGAFAAGGQRADDHRHAQAGRQTPSGPQHTGDHHHAQQGGHQVNVDQLGQHANAQRQAHGQHDDQHPGRPVHGIRAEEIQKQQQNGDRRQHQHAGADVHHDVHIIVVQKAEAAQHFQLVDGHALTGQHDVLALLVDDRLHRLAGFLPQGLGGGLIHQHVGLHHLAQDGRDHVLQKIDIGLVAHDLLQVLDGFADISFADGGVHGVFHGGGQVAGHIQHLLIRGVEQGLQLIAGQSQLGQLALGVAQLGLVEQIGLLGHRIAGEMLFQKVAAVLLHRIDLLEHRLQIGHNLGGDGLVENIAGLHLGGGLLPLAGGAHLVHHVLGGGDGGVGDLAGPQVVPLGGDGQRHQGAQQHHSGDDHHHGLGHFGGKDLPECSAFLFSGFFRRSSTGHHLLYPSVFSRRRHRLSPRSVPDRGAQHRSG